MVCKGLQPVLSQTVCITLAKQYSTSRRVPLPPRPIAGQHSFAPLCQDWLSHNLVPSMHKRPAALPFGARLTVCWKKIMVPLGLSLMAGFVRQQAGCVASFAAVLLLGYPAKELQAELKPLHLSTCRDKRLAV